MLRGMAFDFGDDCSEVSYDKPQYVVGRGIKRHEVRLQPSSTIAFGQGNRPFYDIEENIDETISIEVNLAIKYWK